MSSDCEFKVCPVPLWEPIGAAVFVQSLGFILQGPETGSSLPLAKYPVKNRPGSCLAKKPLSALTDRLPKKPLNLRHGGAQLEKAGNERYICRQTNFPIYCCCLSSNCLRLMVILQINDLQKRLSLMALNYNNKGRCWRYSRSDPNTQPCSLII